MELDDLKQRWQQLELRIDKAEEANRRLAEKLKKNKATTAKQRLATRLGLKLFLCVMSPLWMIFFDTMTEVSETLYVSYMVFFAVMTIVMAHLCYKLRITHYMEMSVKDALMAVYDMEWTYRRAEWIGFITGIPLMVFLMIEIHRLGIPSAVYGAWFGLMIGLAVGIYSKIRNRRLLREMRRALGRK